MTQHTLSLGKVRALQRSSTPEGFFTILALDHQDALRRVLDPQNALSLSEKSLVDFKLDTALALQQCVSGVLLDPVYSAAQAVERNIVNHLGLLVALEKADYGMEPMPLEVELRPGWSVAKIKSMNADGVKLFFYYHPEDTRIATLQDALIQRVVADCAHYDIPLYAEPILYASPQGPPLESAAYASARPRVLVEAARRVAGLGADVLKLEFPVDVVRQPDEAQWARACCQVSDAVDVPWVLLSAGVDYPTFCRQVEVACRCGASGFIVGRALWGEACRVEDPEKRRQWLQQEGQKRMQRLVDIVQQHATPWQQHYAPEPVSTTWFQTYGHQA